LPGDANDDGSFNIVDVTFGIEFIFSGGSAPPCQDQADVNGSGRLDISDVTFSISYIFSGGFTPICGITGS
ncbi:MAG TPA: dockerin type I domain-containing protein, partial [candidate division Zixibacteria bacterium]|nr:dockerin type I domain-containing protein [candidate division Zixibacteria bacterium]